MTGPAVGHPRLPPLPPEAYDDAARDALRQGLPRATYDRYFSTGEDALPVPKVPIPNVLGTLAHHPALAGPWLAYNSVLLRAPTLGARLRELLVLRVAYLTRSAYEWTQHVRIADAVGISREELQAIGRGADSPGWSALEAAALRATDQLVADHEIDDATWRRLAEELDARQLVELVFTVGTYTCLAMAFNSFGLQLEPDVPTVPFPVGERAGNGSGELR